MVHGCGVITVQLCSIHSSVVESLAPTGVGSGSNRRRFRCSYLTRLFCYDEEEASNNDDAGNDVNATPDLASQTGQVSGNLVQVGNQSDWFAPH